MRERGALDDKKVKMRGYSLDTLIKKSKKIGCYFIVIKNI
jgi:hypothetical protein